MLEEFITLWAVIDPIGTLPVFIAVTAGLAGGQQRRIAVKAFAVATGVLLAFILIGQVVLDALGISLVAFQIAGGIILFVFAMTMIFGDGKPQTDIQQVDKASEVAVFPLAMPSLASPGAMLTVVLLTDNNRFDLVEQSITAVLVLGVMLIALLIMLGAAMLNSLIGGGGAAVISRIMGMILAAVAVQNILNALATVGVLPAI